MAELTRKQKINLALLVAAVGAVSSMLTGVSQSWLSSTLEAPKLRDEVKTLSADLTKKSAELQKLETEFVPFKTLALQYFTGTEAERISKLAMKLQDLQSGYLALAEKETVTSAKTTEIANRLAPRMISTSQRNTFRRMMIDSAKGKVSISAISGDNEAAGFAQAITSMLEDCGFTITAQSSFIATGQVEGLALVVADNKNTPAHAEPLLVALRTVGLEVRGHIQTGTPLAEVHIIVGPKS